MFQSTRPRGARRRRRRRTGRLRRFNPRAREGRDPDAREASLCHMVSIHAPARGATTYASSGARSASWFQSTRPRGARPRVVRALRREAAVSIHAPARGATSTAEVVRLQMVEFQSTRPRGARPGRHLSPGARRGVSIHAPARGATVLYGAGERVTEVSIHAPARGATVSRALRLLSGDGFNPRAREGRDSASSRTKLKATGFQSTRPRGARLRGRRLAKLSLNMFQSTRPRGARPGVMTLPFA